MTREPSAPVAPDDRPLVRAAQRGDRRALDELLHRHYDRIHALCRRLMGNEADAADATQEALLAIVRGLPRFDGRSAFSTWAYRVTTNACLDELRRRQRRSHVRLVGSQSDDQHARDADPLDQFDRANDAPGLAEQIADRIDIDAGLARLSPEFRAAVVLRDLMGMDYADIAGALGIPSGTVRSRIARGRAQLLAALGNPAQPPIVGPERDA